MSDLIPFYQEIKVQILESNIEDQDDLVWWANKYIREEISNNEGTQQLVLRGIVHFLSFMTEIKGNMKVDN